MPYQQANMTLQQCFTEAVSDALIEAGALSVVIEDANAGTVHEQPVFGEPDMEQRLWEHNVISALFDEHVDVMQIVAEVSANTGVKINDCCIKTLAEQDWVRLTQAQFTPIQISERLWIIPTWHDAPRADAINLRLDPGLAFGTGSHPTTHLCLQWLDNHLRGGEQVLDYGCGSGILTIAALKLGANSAIGVDIDPQAVGASRDNAIQNQVAADFYLPEELPEDEFDIVVANILANPLRMLGQMLAARTKVGGSIVLSGILAEQTTEMSQIYSQWFELNEPIYEQGWACLSGTKRAIL